MAKIKNLLIFFPVDKNFKDEIVKKLPETKILYRTGKNLTQADIREADVIFGNVPADMLADAPNLKWLHLASAGTDGYTPVLDRGIALSNGTGAYNDTIAEHMLAVTGALCLGLPRYARQQQAHHWARAGWSKYIMDSTIAILGCGSIGTAYVRTSNGGWLNLRAYPGTDAGVLAQIPNGSALSVLLKGNYYWMVSYNGEIGFVDISYVTERTPSLPTAAPSTPSTPTTTAGTAIVQTGNSGKLNLREQAYANAGILGRYSNGTAVTVLQKGAAWSYVEVKGQKGYMMSKFLKFTSSAASSRRVYNPNGGTYVNLRSSPNKTSGNVNVRVPVGATVSLLSWGAEWSQVSYGSYTGYMMSWFLQ